jgi:tetratricopeptide (TPR) repeat protein
MNDQAERIARFQKMANDDPENELGHFSLGKALYDAGQAAEAIPAFERTLALNPQFSKAYQLLGEAYLKVNNRDQAVKALREGFAVADERGDHVPRDAMAKLLTDLGEAPPAPRQAAAPVGPGGFSCQRPGCRAGTFARQLPAPPMNDEVGRRIYETVCADCWREWLGMGVKVINELHLDLSDERAQEVYDNYMKEFLGWQ